jgi:hypothetical protein
LAWSAPSDWSTPASSPWRAPDDSAPPAGNGFSPPDAAPGPAAPPYDPSAAHYSGPSPGQYGFPPPGQYGYQPYYTPAPARTNPVAIAALVCGIVQFPLGLFLLNILLAVPAIICGAIGLRQTRQRGEAGRGLAIAGLVLGILGVVYLAVAIVFIVVGLHFARLNGTTAAISRDGR